MACKFSTLVHVHKGFVLLVCVCFCYHASWYLVHLGVKHTGQWAFIWHAQDFDGGFSLKCFYVVMCVSCPGLTFLLTKATNFLVQVHCDIRKMGSISQKATVLSLPFYTPCGNSSCTGAYRCHRVGPPHTPESFSGGENILSRISTLVLEIISSCKKKSFPVKWQQCTKRKFSSSGVNTLRLGLPHSKPSTLVNFMLGKHFIVVALDTTSYDILQCLLLTRCFTPAILSRLGAIDPIDKHGTGLRGQI